MSRAGVGAASDSAGPAGRWGDLLPRLLVVVPAWLVLVAALLRGPAWLVPCLWLPVVWLAAREMAALTGRAAAAERPRPGPLHRALLVAVYGVALPACFPLVHVLHGPGAALLALAVSWGGDCGGYLAGRAFGRHRIAPALSPRKTWEGAAGSLVTALLLAELLRATGLLALPGPGAWALAATANILAQFGDLAESALKRRAGARHSARLFPGGGGMLDAVDGLSPAAAWILLVF